VSHPNVKIIKLKCKNLFVGREGEGQRNGPKTGDNRTAPTHPPRATSTTRREPERGERPRKPGQRAEHEGEERRHERAAEGPAQGARRTAPNTEHGRTPKNPPTHPGPRRRDGRDPPLAKTGQREAGRDGGRPTFAHEGRRGRAVGQVAVRGLRGGEWGCGRTWWRKRRPESRPPYMTPSN
jgi:hypothetical protein